MIFFPNPATDYIRIESDDITDESIIIISDNARRVVLKQTGLVSANNEININTLSFGVYYYTVITDSNTYNGKFIKQ